MERVTYALISSDGVIGDWSAADMRMLFDLTGATGIGDIISSTETAIAKQGTDLTYTPEQLQALTNGVAFLRALLPKTN